MRLEWKVTCVIIWWGIIMTMFFYQKFKGITDTLLPQCNVSRFSHRREIRVNTCWICHSSVIIAEYMQRHTNKLSVTFLISNSTSCCWEKWGGGAQSTTGTSMIDSGLRLLICSPYKNSHVACELQIIVKNTYSLTYTCAYLAKREDLADEIKLS